MNQELIDLAVQRGRLLERISLQRQLLGQQMQPAVGALHSVDRTLASVRKGGDFLGRHPELVAAVVAVLVVLRPGRVWCWTRRAFFAWRTWCMLRCEMFALGLSSQR